MDLNKELEKKIEIVKKAISDAGGKITQEAIAKKVGKGRTYLSRLKKGHERVTPEFMAFFNETFKEFLPKQDMITKADIASLKSAVDVYAREISKIKRDLYKDKDAKDYLNELLQEVSLSEVGKQALKE